MNSMQREWGTYRAIWSPQCRHLEYKTAVDSRVFFSYSLHLYSRFIIIIICFSCDMENTLKNDLNRLLDHWTRRDCWMNWWTRRVSMGRFEMSRNLEYSTSQNPVMVPYSSYSLHQYSQFIMTIIMIIIMIVINIQSAPVSAPIFTITQVPALNLRESKWKRTLKFDFVARIRKIPTVVFPRQY